MSQASTYSPAVNEYSAHQLHDRRLPNQILPRPYHPHFPLATPSTAASAPSQSPNARKRRLAEIVADEVEVEEELEKARQRVEALEADRKRLRAEQKSLQ
ncbi:hypothetical protein ABVK25_009201 [Lepraria finkii]|uniref:Uncharacterized protein n=1 Tax=Lepraria finkii TaxID=1340010 RepID=A0ABR4AXZ2_9LECA